MRLLLSLPLAALLAAAPSHAQGGDELPPLNERERAAHVLNRLAYGPRPGDIERVMEIGVEAWIEEQLSPSDEIGVRLEAKLERFETLGLSVAECSKFVLEGAPMGDDPESRRERRLMRRKPVDELMEAVPLRAALSERQLDEVMSDFWRNHFNVSFTKGQAIWTQLPHYEASVVQAHLWGRFPDMLVASATHPAMLHYLDNHLSRKPPTEQQLKEIERREKRRTGSDQRGEEAAAIAAQRGLNENYARELLELHTLGVDNYYEQDDVIAVAEILTGWTFTQGRDASYEYVFRPNLHVEGDRKVLGKRVREDEEGGAGQGMELLEMLGEHKGTADFVAMKMVRYLVADQPPEDLVKEVAKTYRKTDGDIPSMVRAIIESEEFWSREYVGNKFKTPYEYLVSALRAVDADIQSLDRLEGYLRNMGQPVYHCDDPTGYYDTAYAWLDPGVMALRWQFATDLAGGKIRGVRIPDTLYDRISVDVPPELWQHHLTRMILPGGAGERTRAALATVTSEYLAMRRNPDLYELGPQLVGLLLGSPEFQKQ
jgi:uncharacterized protein (DUF1800 family)